MKCSSSGYCSGVVPAKSHAWYRVNFSACGCTPSVSSYGHVHVLGRVPPAGRLLGVDAELAGPVRVPVGRVGGGRDQVPLGHQVRVDVVVGDRAVLVRAGHPVDVETARAASWCPSDRHSRAVSISSSMPGPALERLVTGGVDVAHDGVGDVGVDVERGRAGRPVARALLAGDRPPRERGPGQPELRGPLLGQRQRAVPPAQRARGRVRRGDVEHRQHERLGVPERVPVVAGAGQALGRDRPVLAARARPAGRGTARTAPPAAPRCRRRPPRPTRPRTRRGRRAGRPAGRPTSLCRAPLSAAHTWSRTAGSDRSPDQP